MQRHPKGHSSPSKGRPARPMADLSEWTTIEVTDVGFPFAGGETEAANTNISIPHSEFPQRNSVNVVANQSTPFSE